MDVISAAPGKNKGTPTRNEMSTYALQAGNSNRMIEEHKMNNLLLGSLNPDFE